MNVGCLVFFQEIHPDAFRDLKIMVELDLSHNNISQIKPETFAGNERLQTLTLAHNFITQLAPYQFPPLKHLVSSLNYLGS
jgi:Leucine-rich repeat (LRR) protein